MFHPFKKINPQKDIPTPYQVETPRYVPSGGFYVASYLANLESISLTASVGVLVF